MTLLFLPAVGLKRIWDLRGYSGDDLALLTGRRCAYGFWHPERFLSQVARAGGAETLTDALVAWTARLWSSDQPEPGQPLPAFYVDGHKKPVYTTHLIPRGLVGRTGKVLGCRTLLLLHDAAGHPLLATTDRGDLALTKGVPAFLTRYEQAADPARIARLIVDREGLAAELPFGIGGPGTNGGNGPARRSVRRAGLLRRGGRVCPALPRSGGNGHARGGPSPVCPPVA